MRATDGAMHQRCMEICAELSSGVWPAATAGSLASDVEVTWDDQTEQMVMLDYPGEVFRQAFVEGGTGEQAIALRGHVDRAAAVILLIDPANVQEGAVHEQIDDDYGMVQAVHYIRRSGGGEEVPVAVALTKCDEHVGLIRAAGGARAFVETHVPNLMKYGGRLRMYATAAVRTRSDALGRPVPNTQHAAAGLTDALTYCMKRIARTREATAAAATVESRQEAVRQAVRRDAELRRQATARWTVFWAVAAAIAAIVTLAALLMAFGDRSGGADQPPEEGVTAPADQSRPAAPPDQGPVPAASPPEGATPPEREGA